MKDYFMKTDRIGFSTWKSDDIILAHKLWGEKNVTKFEANTKYQIEIK